MEHPSAETLSSEKTLRHRFRGIGNFCGAVILAMYAMQILIILLGVLLKSLGLMSASEPNYGWGFFGKELWDLGVYLLFLIVPAILVARITRIGVAPFPTRRVHPALFVCVVLGGMVIAVFSNVCASYVMFFLENSGVQATSPNTVVDSSVWGLVLSLVSTAVFPALAEEMVFRGFILGALRPLGNGAAVVLSAAVFGLFHGNVQQFVFAFLLGLAFAVLTVQTGSIWPAVALHFSNNAMSVFIRYASNFVSEEHRGSITIVTFALVSFVGMIAICVLLATDRGGTARADVLRPVRNAVGAFSTPKRIGYVFTAPLWILAWVVMLIDIAGTVSTA